MLHLCSVTPDALSYPLPCESYVLGTAGSRTKGTRLSCSAPIPEQPACILEGGCVSDLDLLIFSKTLFPITLLIPTLAPKVSHCYI